MIKNIALTAAFISASPLSDSLDGSMNNSNKISFLEGSQAISLGKTNKIGMKQLIVATKKELEKKGKPILKSDFGSYYKLLE